MKARTIVSSVAFNYIGTIIAAGLGFLTTPIILHGLGPANYGIWAIVSSVITYSALLDLGVGLTVMRLVAERAHLEDRAPLRRVASTGLVLYTGLGLVVVVLGLVLAGPLGRAFDLVGPDAQAFEMAFAIIAVAMGLTFPAGLYTGLNNGLGRYRQQNTIAVFQAVTTAATAVLVVTRGGGIVPLALGVATCAVVAFLIKIVYAARAYQVYPDPRLVSRPVVREVLTVSGWVFVASITSRIVWEADSIILGAVLGTTAVAHYVVALGPSTAVRRLSEQFNPVSLTAASSLRARQESEHLKLLLSEGTRVAVAMSLPFLTVFALWHDEFMSLWVGPDFRGSGPVLVVLLVAISFAAIQATSTMVLIAVHEQRAVAITSLTEATANVVLSIVLARQFGIIGVAIGTAAPIVLTTTLFFLPRAASKVGHRAIAVYRGFVPVVALNVVGGLALALLPGSVFSSLFVFALTALPVIGLLATAGVLANRHSRPTYLSMVRPLWAPLAGQAGRGR